MENNNTKNKENLTFEEEKSIKVTFIERNTVGSLIFRPHCHLRLELLRVTSGELNVTVNKKNFVVKAGSVVVINSFNIHTAFSGNDGVKCYAIMFDLDRLYNDSTITNKFLVPLKEQLLVLDDYITDNEILIEIDHIIDRYNSKSMRVMGGIYNLLGLFFDKGYYKSNIKIPTNKKFHEIVNYINKYVDNADKYTEDLNVPQLAKAFGYNPSYLCRKFKEYTGLSVSNYISLLRLERAQVLLVNSDIPISRVACESGFNDIVYFSHCFKKHFGVSPSTFRKENLAPLNYKK